MCNIKYSVPKKSPTGFHNGSHYYYHFIISFTCLGRNTEKYTTFTVPIEKELTRINKNGKEITKNISHILQF